MIDPEKTLVYLGWSSGSSLFSWAMTFGKPSYHAVYAQTLSAFFVVNNVPPRSCQHPGRQSRRKSPFPYYDLRAPPNTCHSLDVG